jgi:hypothetical protein
LGSSARSLWDEPGYLAVRGAINVAVRLRSHAEADRTAAPSPQLATFKYV